MDSMNRYLAVDNGHYHPTEVVSDKIPALLMALVTPNETLKRLQDESDFTSLLVMQEEIKTLPFGEVWAQYCRECGVPEDGAWLPLVKRYEQDVLVKRV